MSNRFVVSYDSGMLLLKQRVFEMKLRTGLSLSSKAKKGIRVPVSESKLQPAKELKYKQKVWQNPNNVDLIYYISDLCNIMFIKFTVIALSIAFPYTFALQKHSNSRHTTDKNSITRRKV